MHTVTVRIHLCNIFLYFLLTHCAAMTYDGNICQNIPVFFMCIFFTQKFWIGNTCDFSLRVPKSFGLEKDNIFLLLVDFLCQYCYHPAMIIEDRRYYFNFKSHFFYCIVCGKLPKICSDLIYNKEWAYRVRTCSEACLFTHILADENPKELLEGAWCVRI